MKYDLADVFTEHPIVGGNQLAVFAATDTELPSHLMQAVALEMNLSETVFLAAAEDAGDVRVRMWSTVVEVDFAGHPLLGTACIVAHHRGLDEGTLRVETNVGIVPIAVHRKSPGRYTAWMDQPLPRTSPVPADQGDQLLSVLGLENSELPITRYDAGIPHLYVMASTPEAVRAIVPDFAALGRVAGSSRINVFALTGAGTVVTRMFSPRDRGFPEDPACGSAAGPLVAHLVRYGLVASGQQITLSQGEMVNRPSTLYGAAVGDRDEISSIRVGGGVCLIGKGRLSFPADLLGNEAASDKTEVTTAKA